MSSTTKHRNCAGRRPPSFSEGEWEMAHPGRVRPSMAPGATSGTLGGGNAEMLLEGGAIVLEGGAVGLVHHHAACEDDGAVGDAENFLGILLDHDRRGPLLADDALQRD